MAHQVKTPPPVVYINRHLKVLKLWGGGISLKHLTDPIRVGDCLCRAQQM